MATLVHSASNQVRPVPGRLLIGRGPSCGLRLEDRHVSGEHATLIWTGQHWEIRDLGSSNGTFVGTERVAPGQPVRLEAGAALGFGTTEDPWVLQDTGAPAAIAVRTTDGEVRTASAGLLALPDEATPSVLVFADARGRWVLEEEGEARPVRDGEVISIDGATWRVRIPAMVEGTAAVDSGPRLDTVTIEFAVSRDEEHVQITLQHRGGRVQLEPREHGYTLLVLARQRLEDAELAAAEQGWVDRKQLLRMLNLESNALNVMIYRARGQLSSAGLDGAAGIVEVRRGRRRFGIEPGRISVVPL